jgi:glycine dehydrogenase
MSINLHQKSSFADRHHGSSQEDTQALLQTIGMKSVEELIEKTIPASIRLKTPMKLPKAQSEAEFLKTFKKLASKNLVEEKINKKKL